MTILQEIIKIIRAEFKKLPDKREGVARKYSIEDIAMSAFAVFFFQNGSWLNFQRNMTNTTGRSNAKSLFGIESIPSDNHIRDILDGVEVEKLQVVFDKIYKLILNKGMLDEYQFFDKTLLVLLDGTHYHASKKIHCDHCQTRVRVDAKGKKYTEYYHSAITPIIAHPKKSKVLALLPEMITNKDGEGKQDCEINASKRWLEKSKLSLSAYTIAILGDDLYCHAPFIKDLREQKHNFILVCKETSHKKMYEEIEFIRKLGEVDTKVVSTLDKSRRKETYSYEYLNEVNLTGADDSIQVHWCSVEVTDEKGKITYRGAFATDYKIDEHNIEQIVEAGRTRWKIENENNNTLKTGGYNLSHNYGHGKKGLSELLMTMNIMSFLTHTICLEYDDKYKEIYELINNRKTFFNHANTFTTFFYISDFDTLWHTMIKGYTDGLHLS